jgi:hypothetical protein
MGLATWATDIYSNIKFRQSLLLRSKGMFSAVNCWEREEE